MNKILKRILEHRAYKDGKNYIGGFKVISPEHVMIQDKIWYLTFYNSYRNMVKAFRNLKIPVKIMHYIVSGRENLIILTSASSVEGLMSQMETVRNVVSTAFPDYEVTRLTPREIGKIYGWKKLESDGFVMLNFEVTETVQGVKPRNIFKIPIQRSSNGREIILGRLLDNDEKYSFSLDDLSNHLVCLGATGMGKTTTVATILNQLPKDIGYLVLDYHNEYSSLLKDLDVIIRPGVDGVALNPFASNEEDIEENVSVITDIFSEIYGFTHSQAYFFRNVLEAVFNSYILTGEKEPNLNALIKILEEYPVRSYSEHETKAALLRRFKQLTQGQSSKIFMGENNMDLDKLLNKRVVIEMGHIKEVSIKRIFGYILLKNIFNIQSSLGRKSISHVTVLEEARYLIPARRDYDPPSIAEKMVDEVRKFGESIFLISQFPSQIAKAPIKNSGFLILHRITGSEDLWYIKNVVALSEEQMDYIKQLSVGEAVIKDSRNPLPFPVRIEPNI